MIRKYKSIFVVIYFVLAIFSWAVLFGEVIRGEASASVFDELSIQHGHGALRVILVIFMYSLFYSCSFSFVYVLLCLVLSLIFQEEKILGNPKVKVGIGFVSFANFIFSLVFLRPSIEFVKAIPSDVWNGWLLILGTASILFFAFAGIRTIHIELKTIKTYLHK